MPLGGVLALMVVFFANRFFDTGLNYGEDLLEYEIPWAAFFLRGLASGDLPLWNPHAAMGVPALGSPLMGPFYPLFVLYALLPAPLVVNVGFLVHIGLSAVFMFWLARGLGLSLWAQAFCATVWAYCSLFVQYSESGWLAETIAVAYLPATLLFIIESARSTERKTLSLLLAGVCCALGIAGGHVSYSVVTVGCVLLFWAPLVDSQSAAWRLGLWLGFVALLTIAIWGPLALQASLHPGVASIQDPYRPAQFLSFLWPTGLRRGFIGRVALFLGCLGFFAKGHPYRWSLRVLFLGTLALVQVEGIWLPLPVRYSSTWHVGLILSLVLSSGVAFDRLPGILRRRGWSGAVPAALILIVGAEMADLYDFNRRFYPAQLAVSFEAYFPDNPLVASLRRDHSLFRLDNTTYDAPVFRVNEGFLLGIDVVQARLKGPNLFRLTGGGDLTTILRLDLSREALDLSNVKYVLTEGLVVPDQYRGGGFTLVATTEMSGMRYALLENRQVLPRAFLSDTSTAELLLRHRTALRDLNPSPDVMKRLRAHREVEIQRTNGRYRIDYQAAASSFLYLAEMYAPGWEVTVDGEPAALVQPFGVFMGAVVPAGSHTVVFAFRPLAIWALLAINTAAVVVTAVVGVRLWRRRRLRDVAAAL